MKQRRKCSWSLFYPRFIADAVHKGKNDWNENLINPNLFYSAHGLLRLQLFSAYWWLVHAHYQAICLIYSKPYIWCSVGRFHLSIPCNHKVNLFKTKFISFSQKRVHLDFFTMVTGTSAHPVRPNIWVPPMTPSSISPHDQVFMFLSFKRLLYP